MAKEEKDIVIDIPLDARIPELEEQVQRYLQIIKPLPENKKIYKREKEPSGSQEAKVHWQKEQIRRCINGHDGMTGKMYFWFNFAHIKNLKGGKIAPEFRNCDNQWFNELEDARENQEGLVCVKRRRAGFSWKAASDALHDAMFRKFSVTGLNSKSERDSVHLFQKIVFIYDNLPEFLKATIGSKRGMKISFYTSDKDKNGNSKKGGSQSEINVVPPTDSAYEGLMLSKWICDEAGKIPNLPQMWSYTEDCLMQETIRYGQPIIFGTSGDISKDGVGLMAMWQNADVYKLRRFFFGGWMGLHVDEYGNDKVEEAVRWIVYERKRRESLPGKEYSDFLQRYPLTPEEAFSQYTESGIGDIKKINAQITSLIDNPVKERRGYFVIDENENVTFQVSANGKGIMYEERTPHDIYLSGCDPADHDDAVMGSSDLSLHVIKKGTGLVGPKIVFEYVDRPDNLIDYYNQAYYALLYYNKSKCLIEKNRYRMISHFTMNSWQNLLATPPQGLNRLFPVRSSVIGIHMNTDVKNYMKGIISDYVDAYCDLIPSIKLLQEFVDFGARNTDRVFSFGLALILLREDKRKVSGNKRIIPSYSYKRVNGKIIRVTK